MIRQAGIAVSLLLLTTTVSFAEGRADEPVTAAHAAQILVPLDSAVATPSVRLTLNPSEIAAIQYHEPSDGDVDSEKVPSLER